MHTPSVYAYFCLGRTVQRSSLSISNAKHIKTNTIMKKLLSVCFFGALLCAAPLSAADFQSGDLYYDITSKVEPYTVEVAKSPLYNGYSLTTAVIPETVSNNGTTYAVTGIGQGAFYQSKNLASVTIPESVTNIRSSAFENCAALTSVTIPDGVERIWSLAFYDCSALESVRIGKGVQRLSGNVFSRCPKLTSISVDSENGTYDSREECNAIIMTATSTLVTGCRNTVIPAGVASIGESAFYYCTGLTSIVIPNSVTSIGESAFASCSALASVVMSENVETIGKRAFQNCEVLASIALPERLNSIGELAFSYCTTLSAIAIPVNVTSIGERAFLGCRALASITVASGNSTYDSREECNAIIETATNTLTTGCANTVIPANVTSIGNHAFNNCSGLTSIVIPAGVASIGEYAFTYCTGLTSITCMGNVPPTCMYYAFEKVPRTIPLYVPKTAVETYKAAETWQEFDVQAQASDPTGIESAPSGQTQPRKVVRDGQVVILREDKAYSIEGKEL